MPAKTVVPTGWSRYSKDVTTPKFECAPRTPKQRSTFSVELALRDCPSAVTMSTDNRLSSASPCLRMSQPKPPPSVTPADPCFRADTSSRGESKPLSLAIKLAPSESGFGAGSAACGIHAYALHPRQVKHQAAVAHRVACDVVPATSHRYGQILGAGEIHTGNDIRDGGTANYYGGVPIDARVPDCPHSVIARIAGG